MSTDTYFDTPAAWKVLGDLRLAAEGDRDRLHHDNGKLDIAADLADLRDVCPLATAEATAQVTDRVQALAVRERAGPAPVCGCALCSRNSSSP